MRMPAEAFSIQPRLTRSGHKSVKRGLRADQNQVECEKSLHRLQTDVIDLFYAHVDDRDTPLEETMEAFDRLIKAGSATPIFASSPELLLACKYVSTKTYSIGLLSIAQRGVYACGSRFPGAVPRTGHRHTIADPARGSGGEQRNSKPDRICLDDAE